jgi:hypothetical protein
MVSVCEKLFNLPIAQFRIFYSSTSNRKQGSRIMFLRAGSVPYSVGSTLSRTGSALYIAGSRPEGTRFTLLTAGSALVRDDHFPRE